MNRPEKMSDKHYWCSDCKCFVKENHRCQQWETVYIIPTKALESFCQQQAERIKELEEENSGGCER